MSFFNPVEGSLHVLVAMLHEKVTVNEEVNGETVFSETLAKHIGAAFVVTSRRLLHSEFLIVVVKRVRADVAK